MFLFPRELYNIDIYGNCTTNKVISSVGIHCDSRRKGINSKNLGYVLSHDYWGMGIMTEAIPEIIKYMFEDMKLDIISCCHYQSNIRSKRVIENYGYYDQSHLISNFKKYHSKTPSEVLEYARNNI